MKGRCMRQIPLLATAAIVALSLGGGVIYSARGADDESTPIFGIKLPPGYRHWRLISVAHEQGSLPDLRAILGDDVALKAAGKGRFPTPTAPSLPGSPGATTRWWRARRRLAVT